MSHVDMNARQKLAREKIERVRERVNIASNKRKMRAEPIPENPLESIEYTGNVEVDSRAEAEVVGEVLSVEKRVRENQKRDVDLANETEYWFSVYFQTRAQKDAFLRAVNLFELGDKYLDGLLVAERLGIELPPRPLPYKVGRIDKKLAALT